jgi:hypothetical protein
MKEGARRKVFCGPLRVGSVCGVRNFWRAGRRPGIGARSDHGKRRGKGEMTDSSLRDEFDLWRRSCPLTEANALDLLAKRLGQEIVNRLATNTPAAGDARRLRRAMQEIAGNLPPTGLIQLRYSPRDPASPYRPGEPIEDQQTRYIDCDTVCQALSRALQLRDNASDLAIVQGAGLKEILWNREQIDDWLNDPPLSCGGEPVIAP